MKKILISISCLICSNLIFGQITNPAPYCAAGFDNSATVHYINQVVLGTLNNNSGTTQWPSPHYVYYNNLVSPNIARNSSQTLTVSHDGSTSTHFIACWIDYNRNNVFEASEKIFQKYVLDATNIPNPIITNFVVPANASLGATRMRVMVMEDDNYTWIASNTSLIPCTADASGSFDWGETEDYNLTITSETTPPTTPSVNTGIVTVITNTTAAVAGNVTSDGGTTITARGICYATTPNPDISGTKVTATGTTGNFTANLTSLIASTLYHVRAFASNSVGTSYGADFTFTTTNVGINENETNKISIYPNPNNGKFAINIEKNNIVEIKIYSMIGSLILSQQINKANNEFDLSDNGKGMYFIQYTNPKSGKSWIEKLILK